MLSLLPCHWTLKLRWQLLKHASSDSPPPLKKKQSIYLMHSDVYRPLHWLIPFSRIFLILFFISAKFLKLRLHITFVISCPRRFFVQPYSILTTFDKLGACFKNPNKICTIKTKIVIPIWTVYGVGHTSYSNISLIDFFIHVLRKFSLYLLIVKFSVHCHSYSTCPVVQIGHFYFVFCLFLAVLLNLGQ